MRWKVRNRAGRTYRLEPAEGKTSQDIEKLTEPAALTNWGPQRDGQIRIQKESDRARGTHVLETAKGGVSQDMERKGLNKGHSQT